MKRQARNRPTSGSIKEPQSNQWGLLLPELLEMVIEKLDFEEDRSSILNMRVVHPHWNQVVNGVLERRQLSALSKWTPFHDRRYTEDVYQTKYRPLYIPKLGVAMGGIGVEAGAGITKSLYLCPKSEERMTRVKRGKREETSSSARGASVSSTFSPNLTSVVLHAIQYSPKHLQHLLNEVPQLKTLEIFKTTVMLKDCPDFEAEWPLPPLAKLTTLIVRENSVDYKMTGGKYVISRWLAKSYTSDQSTLTHLDVDNARFVNPWKIEKLEQLKISGLASLPVEQSVATSLVRLSILEIEKDEIAFQDFVGFIQQFSEKLVHLHLDVRMYNFKDVGLKQKQAPNRRTMRVGRVVTKTKLPELALENQVVFNQLKTFAFRFGAVSSCWAAVEYLLQQFPAIEKFQLISTGKPARCGCCLVKLEAESKRIWELCSNLKVIHLYETMEENSFWKTVNKGEVVTNWAVE